MQKLKNFVLGLVTLATVASPALVIAPVYAVNSNDSIIGNLCTSTSTLQVSDGKGGAIGSTGAVNDCGSSNGIDQVNSLLTKVINVFSFVVGVIAVFMIIIGGLRYITSGGDSGKVTAAKTTIIYALVGLVVVALAQLIVHFVLQQANGVVLSN